MDKNKYIDVEFTVGKVPEFVTDPAYYPRAGTTFKLIETGNSYTYSLTSAVGQMPHGWSGMDFEFLLVTDTSHTLPDKPGENGQPAQSRESADRFYGRTHLLGVPFDIWFVAGPDANLIDDTQPAPAQLGDPANVFECITRLVGSESDVQNGGHGTIP